MKEILVDLGYTFNNNFSYLFWEKEIILRKEIFQVIIDENNEIKFALNRKSRNWVMLY